MQSHTKKGHSMTLTQEAKKRLDWAIEQGILCANEETPESIAQTCWEQDIVSFCSEHGSVCFDVDDIIES
jgi:hypothetical protein